MFIDPVFQANSPPVLSPGPKEFTMLRTLIQHLSLLHENYAKWEPTAAVYTSNLALKALVSHINMVTMSVCGRLIPNLKSNVCSALSACGTRGIMSLVSSLLTPLSPRSHFPSPPHTSLSFATI